MHGHIIILSLIFVNARIMCTIRIVLDISNYTHFAVCAMRIHLDTFMVTYYNQEKAAS
jgi:hypothetical protein